ncbi:hypothetical protein [Providencia sp. PROV024]|uniref:hypothetical protein n=1 Tax=Providencia TaxID=586 RepID=UPI002349047E|nr:hypothetical protein [Providencia sp. PROV024]ELR5271139.1 hypothetical protein [Providencia rettgeri]ELY3856737.1 hypothetical protein [Providencia rettgeri]EMD0753803.1 hypothetical protein [Providencia rettgeri]WOC05473.1 hypothetical protein P3L56_06775 [Providencia sp. PROV024]
MSIYQRGQSTALRMLKKYGISYQVKRDGKHWVDDETGQEHFEPETLFFVIGVKTQYKPYEIDGTLILSTDIKMVFSPAVVIQKGDRVFVDGVWLRVQEPNPIKPAELVICYQSQLRA